MFTPILFSSSAAPAFSPASLSGLALWLDASDASTITQSGGSVSQWNDKSGNGRNATQATSSLQPVYRSTGLGTLPAIDFTGTGLPRMDFTSFNLTNYDIFAVLKTNTDNNQRFLVSTGSSSIQLFRMDGYPAVPSCNGTSSSTTWTTTAASLIEMSYASSGTASPYLNNVAASAISTSANYTFTASCIGNDAYTKTPDCYLSMLLIYSRVLSSTERGQIHTYAQSKWGTP